MSEETRIITSGSAREQVDAGLVDVDACAIHGPCNGTGFTLQPGGSNFIGRPCGCNRGWA